MTMGWKEKLKPASFRRVSFYVSVSEVSGGRRTVQHDYPQRDDPYVEDMGLKAREFSIEAYVIGDDYMAQRDALAAACDKSGSDTLIHPYYGKQTAICTGYRVREVSSEGRYAVIALSFVKTSVVPKPVVSTDNTTATVTAAGAALNRAKEVFEKAFSVSGTIGHVATAASEKVAAATDAINAVKNQARKVSAFTQKIGTLVADINLLMLAPGDLANALLDVVTFDFGGGTLTNPYNVEAKIEDLRELQNLFFYGENDVIPPLASPSMIIQATNQIALRDYMQQAAVLSAVRVAVDLSFASYSDAIESRDAIVDRLDSIMETTDDDQLYQAMFDAKNQLVNDIEARSSGLPRIQSYAPPVSLPSLVLAHRLYGTITMEADIIDRNAVRNPAIISGQEPLEVLTNG